MEKTFAIGVCNNSIVESHVSALVLESTTAKVREEVSTTTFSGFEGPEKKLEIDFKRVRDDGAVVSFAPFPIAPSARGVGLRALSRAKLDHICSLVNCTILSQTSNEYFDAYVLSESSLFVYPQKLLMKTCGTTTLLRCVETVLQYAAELALDVEALFYSRQKFIFPDKQKHPHTSFEHETAHLAQIFPGRGQSYCLGDRGGDHWYLYHVDCTHGKAHEQRADRSVEIMMEKLDNDVMRLFFQSTYESVAVAAAAFAAADASLLRRAPLATRADSPPPLKQHHQQALFVETTSIARASSVGDEHAASIARCSSTDPLTPTTTSPSGTPPQLLSPPTSPARVDDDLWRDGVPADVADAIERGDRKEAARAAIRRLLPLHELFDGVVVDDHVFEPCGYSVNGLCGATYVTMHVTPEPTHSFVSFETNCAQSDAPLFMAFVARRLRPGRCSLSVLADACARPPLPLPRAVPLPLPFYRQQSRTTYELFDDDGRVPYEVGFSTFARVTLPKVCAAV